MQDSTVKITITAIDGASKVFQGVGDIAVKQAQRAAAAYQKSNEVTNVAVESTGKLANAAGNASRQQDRLTASTKRSYLAQTALTTVLSASVNQAFLQMVDVTGQAVERVDLLANFPKSMAALGLSATDASESLAKLSDYIGQIGGNLQEATTSVARFAEVTGNVKAATAEFVGLNNALIAGGAGATVQASALEQFIQAYSRGIPQLIEWRSLMVAMPAQLNAVAKSMNFVNAQALGEALTNGEVSMQDFVTKLTELSTGTGPIAQQALARMSGIQFAFNVFKNTLVEGMTSIIQTIGRQNIIDFFNLLTGVVRQLAVWAVQLISILFSLFNIVSRVFGGPQLKLAKDNTAGIADNIGGAADNAGDLADGLDDAAKAANKSLASFDKMNVLTKGTDTGKDKKESQAGEPLSAADAAALEGIFDTIGGKLKDITQGSKILAGILASIAGIKFAQGLLNQFNGIVKSVQETAKSLDDLKKKLFGADKDTTGLFGKAKKSSSEFGSAIANMGAALIAVFSNSKLGTAITKFSKILFAPLLAASGVIIDAFLGLAVAVGAALGVSLGAAIAIIVAAVAVIVGLIYVIWTNWDTIWGWMKDVASTFWQWLQGIWDTVVDAFVTAWHKLYDIFAAPFKWFVSFFDGVFIALVAIVAIFIQAIVVLFVALVKGIYNVLKAVAGWIYDNVIQPIVNFFKLLWDSVVEVFTFAISIILDGILAPIVTWIYDNVIQPIINLYKFMWDAIVAFASGFFNSLKISLGPIAGWIFNNVISPIANLFSGLWDGIYKGLSSLINGFSGLLGGITNIFKSVLNGIFDLLNLAIKAVNKLKVPDWVPGVGGKSPGIQLIPHLARGGVLTQRTLVEAGENGDEAIVPLENNTEWIDKLAAKINGANGNGGMPLQLTVQIGEDKIVSKVVDLINEKTQMSGRNAIYV